VLVPLSSVSDSPQTIVVYCDQRLYWIVQCFTSPPTQYRLYGRRFLQVKRPNQQYQSTEGESTKENNPENKENTKYTCIHTKW